MFSNCLWGKSSLYFSCTTYRLHLVIINGRVNVLYRVFLFPTNTPTCYIFKLFSITSTCTCLKEYGLYRHPHSLRHSTSLLLNTRSGVLPFLDSFQTKVYVSGKRIQLFKVMWKQKEMLGYKKKLLYNTNLSRNKLKWRIQSIYYNSCTKYD